MPQTIDNMIATWNNAGTTFTFLKANITDTASAAGSLLMDLQVGGSSRFSVGKSNLVTVSSGTVLTSSNIMYFGGSGQTSAVNSTFSVIQDNVTLSSTARIGFGPSNPGSTMDAFLSRRAAANLRLGAADAAAPVAQTLSVQSGTAGASALSCSISGTTLTVGGAVTGTIAIGHAVTGTGVSAGTVITAGSGTTWTVNNSQTVSSTTMYFNSVGQNLTITGSQGSGPSAGGSIVFQVAPAGSAGTTAQNALATALTIDSTSTVTLPGKLIAGGTGLTAYSIQGTSIVASTQLGFVSGGANRIFANAVQLSLIDTAVLGWANGDAAAALDVILRRDAANTLALRNGGTSGTPVPQTFRVYNWTDGTNSEFGKIAWSSNVLQIGTEKAGTGSGRNLELQTDGTTRFILDASGLVRSAGALVAGGANGLGWYLRSYMLSPSDGVILFQNQATNDFNRLQFGGTTSSFPALKRSSTTLQARLADDSAFASVQGKLTTDTAYAAGDPTTTGYLVVYDSTGTAYKIPAVAV